MKLLHTILPLILLSLYSCASLTPEEVDQKQEAFLEQFERDCGAKNDCYKSSWDKEGEKEGWEFWKERRQAFTKKLEQRFPYVYKKKRVSAKGMVLLYQTYYVLQDGNILLLESNNSWSPKEEPDAIRIKFAYRHNDFYRNFKTIKAKSPSCSPKELKQVKMQVSWVKKYIKSVDKGAIQKMRSSRANWDATLEARRNERKSWQKENDATITGAIKNSTQAALNAGNYNRPGYNSKSKNYQATT
ncbi:MAG: hypothetical protein HOM21_07405, partial [Halobacteriovoraceae bacterium]|nr:hypothetical protein [Halobacteriovoraceae bacterium]